MLIYHDEKEVYSELPIFSASGSGSDGRCEDEMTKALVDVASEINFAPDDDIVEDIESVDQDASTFDAMFEELQSELWPGCTKMSSLNFLVNLMHLNIEKI